MKTTGLLLARPDKDLIPSYLEALREGMRPARYPTAEEETGQLLHHFEDTWPFFAQRIRNGYDDASFCLEDMYWISEDGKFIGYIGLKTSLKGLQALYGGHVGREIRPSCRGKGYGTRALTAILPFARQESLGSVDLVTAHDNHAAIASIRKCGGQLVENIPVPDPAYFDRPAVRYRIFT